MNKLLILSLAIIVCAHSPAAAVDAWPQYQHDGFAELVREIPPTIELHQTMSLPSGSWIRCNPSADVPVYLCDRSALLSPYLVMQGGIGIFLTSGCDCVAAAHELQAMFPGRHDLAQLCGDGCPDALIAALRVNASPP